MELARFGILVRLIDKKASPETTSRAIGVQARTLEHFELRGRSEEMVRLGNPGVAASVYDAGKQVFRLDCAHIDSRYAYLLFLSQAETGRILREKLGQLGVTLSARSRWSPWRNENQLGASTASTTAVW